ncbi:hypothetical protein [Spirosoma sp. KNUC1025]|uniref:hypothetical protein n=1 Tax=Spirosoma sp. KNUC1025 TaxID=2894082 RepID=UPI001E3D43B1|nr:hypothetical protein [Spirosoma sp. KNUC1025]UFH57725.1 hypothetical protein LN737_32370 [Spirosoma sp. KNUC1025]
MNAQASSKLATDYARQLSQFFSTDQLDDWARKTGFIVRARKLSAVGWLKMLLSESANLYHFSLGQECGLLAAQAQIYLKKQSLQERWTPTCIAFLRKVITQLLEQQLGYNSAQLGGPFKRIIIGDSTSFELPACHQNTYKGYGGSSSPSALKIYYEYDLKAGMVIDLQDSHGTHADTRFNRTQQVEAGDLILQDLGFFTYGFYQQV